ncbi:uncharacterized protein LOC141686933 [Apium graveolens]|uniref:uncharacterized protein LOC141686933 n=1 Tax=Apium graveolens TaxID=4045 RepID=UPI003D792A50
MCQIFVTQFQVSVTYSPPSNTLDNIKQREAESLREYFKYFNTEVSKVRRAPYETYKNFMIAGVKPCTEFWKELQREEPKTLNDFYNKTESHKVVEESLANLKRNSFGNNGTWNKNKRTRKGYVYPQQRKQARYMEYTPLKAPINHIFEMGDKACIFKKPYRSGPSGMRDEEKYCVFHDANGHDTADCHHLKDHIEDLIHNGYVRYI